MVDVGDMIGCDVAVASLGRDFDGGSLTVAAAVDPISSAVFLFDNGCDDVCNDDDGGDTGCNVGAVVDDDVMVDVSPFVLPGESSLDGCACGCDCGTFGGTKEPRSFDGDIDGADIVTVVGAPPGILLLTV